MTDRNTILVALAAIAITAAGCGRSSTLASAKSAPDKEFIGPFPSWADLKSGYGAKGDGTADDTAALQRALNDLGTAGKPDVLFLPTGTYRITSTLELKYRTNVSMVGADAARTVIRWSGPREGTMMRINGVAHSRWGGLTWEGAGLAAIGVAHQWDRGGGYAPTHLEHEGEVFQNLGKGLVGGLSGGANDAEVTISHGRFLNCSVAGISVESFNALSYWIWDSEFVNNARGVTNEFGAGNFMVYRSLFRNSSVADLSVVHTQYFSFRWNTSIRSRQFFHAKNSGQNAAPTTIQENTILDTLNPAAIEVENVGPLILLDNQIRSAEGAPGPAVQLSSWAEGGDLLAIGNSYTVENPVSVRTPSARQWVQDDRVVPRSKIVEPALRVAGTAAAPNRTVLEVPAGAHSDAIQQAIDKTVSSAGHSPVIHLPKGDYFLDQTVRVPANLDLQVIGDGRGTRLIWKGASGGAMFEFAGPSKATVRELNFEGENKADGLVINGADQPGSRIHVEGIFEEHTVQNNLLMVDLANTMIELQSHQMQQGKAPSIRAVGIGGGGGSRVAIFGGTTGAAESGSEPIFEVSKGGRIVVEDMWYEGPASRLVYLKDSGTFTYNGGHVAPQSSPLDPVVEVAGFNGTASFLGVDFDLDQPRKGIQVTSESSNTNLLLFGVQANLPNYFSRVSSSGNVEFLSNKVYRKGAFPAGNLGKGLTPEFALRMLNQLRNTRPDPIGPLPSAATDMRIYRVGIAQTVVGISIRNFREGNVSG